MKPITIPLLAVFLFAPIGPAMAEGSGLGLSAGMEYSSGKYGAQQTTDIWYFPVAARYETGPWILKLTLSYVQITGPGNVVGGNDNVVRTAAAGKEERRGASGPGDVVAAATRTIYRNPAHGLLLDLTGKAKFATADADKGLGTGKNDFSLQADLIKQSAAWMFHGSLGRRQMGDPAGIDFRNPWFGSLGAGYRLGGATQVGVAYETRQRVIEGGARLGELMAFATYRLTPIHTLQGYVVKGFSAGSPDWGAGGVVNAHF